MNAAEVRAAPASGVAVRRRIKHRALALMAAVANLGDESLQILGVAGVKEICDVLKYKHGRLVRRKVADHALSRAARRARALLDALRTGAAVLEKP